MNPFWEFLVDCLPKWMAPNFITILGLLTMTLTYMYSMGKIIFSANVTKFEIFLIILANFIY